ncbi:MAG: hypothetical protein R3E32_09495 [Chitinophagales bacterium]
MSRTHRNHPFKLPVFAYETKEEILDRDGISSKISPPKEYKKQYNQKFRTQQKRNLKQGKPFNLKKNSHIEYWW